ncbi:MAG TPA: lysozyme inhibitor LprI family protein [Pseudogracilibacillus sp.]|nr:lysozyme inhibitor LprI family protein [Pseudogracilibacillus sp.]
MKRIFLIFAIIFVLVGCNSAFKDSVTEAEAALENGDFENALKLFNVALEEKPDSPEVKDRIALLDDYATLQEKMENAKWTEAVDLANDILKKDAIVPSLQTEVEELLTTIEEEEEKEKQMASDLKKIEELIANDDVEKANSKISELESKTNALDRELDDVHNQLEVAEKRIAEKERKEKERKEKEAEKKRLEAEAKQQATEANNLKEKYMQKADNLDDRIMSKAKELFEQDVQPGFYGQYHREWDDLLNEVWGELKKTMPTNEFEQLKSEQNDWIKNKEQTFAEIPDEPASARAAGVDYLAAETKSRTYYLIENYMNE